MIFRFKMLSDESDTFVRDYEVAYDMPLVDFHNFICADLKFDNSQMASFFTSDAMWGKLHEYTLLDMGEGIGEEIPSTPMDGIKVDHLIRENHDRLIYLFDMFGDRALYLELMGTYPAETGTKYPRCIASEGAAPDQFDAAASEGGDGSIFDEVMADFNDFEGDESYEDD